VEDDFVARLQSPISKLDPNNDLNSSECFLAIFKITSDLSEILYFFSTRNASSKANSGSSVFKEFLFRFFEAANCSNFLFCSSCPFLFFWRSSNISITLSSFSVVGVVGIKGAKGGTIGRGIGAVVDVDVVVVVVDDVVVGFGRDFFVVFFPEVRQDLETT